MKEINIKGPNEIVYEHILSNGLKVYIWKYPLSEEINLSLTTLFGSIHTDFKANGKSYHVPNGIAHFLEHVKFNEDKDVTAHDFFYKIGSYTNAYTTYDHTSYEVVCNNDLKENLDHLLYFVFNPYFTKGLVQKEKPIIIEEAKMTLNDPYNEGYNLLMENLYLEDNKRYLITGTPEEVKSITLEDVLNVFNSFYVPNNMFLTVTGNVNPYEVEKIVEEYFTNKPIPKKDIPSIISKKEPNKVGNTKNSINTNVTKEKLLYALKIPKKGYNKYNDLYLRIYFNILLDINFNTTSDFNSYLIKNNIIDDLYYSVNVDDNHICIIFESSTSYPNELSKMIKDKINNLDVNENDFKRKTKTLIASSILGYEDAVSVNSDIRMDIVRYKHIIDDVKGLFESLNVKDLTNIKELIKDYKIVEVILNPNH